MVIPVGGHYDLAGLGSQALACLCLNLGKPTCEYFSGYAAVFVGSVLSVEPGRNAYVTDPSQADGGRRPLVPVDLPTKRTIRFRVETTYRGVASGELTLTTGIGNGDCGYDFRIGEKYLVYAHKAGAIYAHTAGDKGGLETGTCSGTKPYSHADQDLQFLDNLATATPDRVRSFMER